MDSMRLSVLERTMLRLVITAIFLQMVLGEEVVRGPPMVDTKPLFLDSYIPAGMQIIAHVTELMKFDLKPSTGPASTTPKPGMITTTTIRTPPPTRPHKPGVFAPDLPPGPDAYFTRVLTYEEYVQRLKYPEGYGYFDRYTYPLNDDNDDERDNQELKGRSLPGPYSAVYGEIPEDLEEYLGKGPVDLLRMVNTLETDFDPRDIDDQVQQFSSKYDDSDFRFYLLKQKRVPPTRAYVSLLSLYDLFNKEAKTLALNKYSGYTPAVLNQLIEGSTGTSSDQMKAIFSNIVKRKDTKNPQILKRLEGLIKDLEDDGSYLNMALRYIPPLKFVP